jgi:hypothetical protein
VAMGCRDSDSISEILLGLRRYITGPRCLREVVSSGRVYSKITWPVRCCGLHTCISPDPGDNASSFGIRGWSADHRETPERGSLRGHIGLLILIPSAFEPSRMWVCQ